MLLVYLTCPQTFAEIDILENLRLWNYVEPTIGSDVRDRARTIRTIITMTGKRSSTKGGGGSGGKNSGNTRIVTVKTTITSIDLTLKNRTIKFLES